MPISLLRVREFADAARMSITMVYAGVANGTIPHCRVNGLLRIPTAALEKFAKDAMNAMREG